MNLFLETTYTLLNLADDLQVILEPVVLLKKIHTFVIIDFSNRNNIVCASSLLAHLHNSLQYSINKLDQDLRVTLYLESLYHYLNIIDLWFTKNDLTDYSGEFLIVKWVFNYFINLLCLLIIIYFSKNTNRPRRKSDG